MSEQREPDTIDLERLDRFLSSDESPEDCMMLSDLNGFLHGVACSPGLVSSHEWMPVALGGPPEDVPEWALEDIASRYMDICGGLISEPPKVEPIFWRAKEGHVIAMDWCEGFMQAVRLRPGYWQPLMDTEEGAELMFPILVHILDENGNSPYGVAQEDLDQTLDEAAGAIPKVAPAISRLLIERKLS